MPGGDRTGPMGLGPMTGRGAGFCAGRAVPGFSHSAPGGGFRGWGRGGGRGWRHRFYATGLTDWQQAAQGSPGGGPGGPAGYAPPPAPPEPELDLLKQQAETLAAQLREIQERIESYGRSA